MADKQKIKKLASFFGIFLGIIGLYYATVLYMNEELFEPYINFNAFLSGKLISLFAGNVNITGNIISTKDITIILSFGCEGSEALVIFLAGVLGFPSPWKYKLKGVLIGGSILYFLNLIRILILYLIGKMDFSVFDLFHNEILPVVFIILSIITWAIWLRRLPQQNA